MGAYDEYSLEELQSEAHGRGLPIEGDEEDLRAALEAYDEDPTPGEGDPTTIEGPPVEIGYDGLRAVSVENPPRKSIVNRP
jgi:hypothetical protein